MKLTQLSILTAVFCLAVGLQASAKNGVKETDKEAKKVAKLAVKSCIDEIKLQLKPLKLEKDAQCITEEDELTEECLALKEQVSALKSQLKACK